MMVFMSYLDYTWYSKCKGLLFTTQDEILRYPVKLDNLSLDESATKF